MKKLLLLLVFFSNFSMPRLLNAAYNQTDITTDIAAMTTEQFFDLIDQMDNQLISKKILDSRTAGMQDRAIIQMLTSDPNTATLLKEALERQSAQYSKEKKRTILKYILGATAIAAVLGFSWFIYKKCNNVTPPNNTQPPTHLSNPLITDLSWGKIQVQHVDGSLHTYENKTCDCKISPSGSRVWNWKDTDTHHNPGVQPADVTELLTDADIIIITRGMDGILQVKPETIAYLNAHNKQAIVQLTRDAVKTYNQLAKEGKRVAGVFHSTC